jgi:hypothetical protein
VPAAAVIRRWQALSGVTGRKELRRWCGKSFVKDPGSTGKTQGKLSYLKKRGENGTLGVGVKSVDIERNTKGEGNFLALS